MSPFKTSVLFLLLLIFPSRQGFLFTAYDEPGRVLVVDIVLESRIARLNQSTPILLEYNNFVRDYILLFTNERRKDMEKMLGLSEHYFPMIESCLDRYGLPFELKYLAVLESGLDPFAVSSSGAVGLWQFLLHSARMFDLEVNSFVDERRDPALSTDAASRYLDYLYETFNDWHLALAAYNGGPGAVRTAIERSGGKRNFWEIREYLPEQTRNYVPAFIAIVYLMNHPAEHALAPSQIPLIAERTDTILARQAVSLQGISKVLNIPLDVLSFLNPSFKTGYIPFSGEKIEVVLPDELVPGFYIHESDIYSVSSVTESGNLTVNPMNRELRRITHRVERGEFLHKIAVRYRTTPEFIRSWNTLQGDTIHEGQELVIWVPGEHFDLLNENGQNQRQQGKSLFLQ